jgi:hypothetical protein
MKQAFGIMPCLVIQFVIIGHVTYNLRGKLKANQKNIFCLEYKAALISFYRMRTALYF